MSSDRPALRRLRLGDLPCIGPFQAATLARINVRTTDDLLRLCRRSSERRVLGKVTGLPEGHLLRWTRIADLMRLEGLAVTVAETLIAAGIVNSTVLAEADAVDVGRSLAGLDAPPPPAQIAQWIGAAARLPSSLE